MVRPRPSRWQLQFASRNDSARHSPCHHHRDRYRHHDHRHGTRQRLFFISFHHIASILAAAGLKELESHTFPNTSAPPVVSHGGQRRCGHFIEAFPRGEAWNVVLCTEEKWVVLSQPQCSHHQLAHNVWSWLGMQVVRFFIPPLLRNLVMVDLDDNNVNLDAVLRLSSTSPGNYQARFMVSNSVRRPEISETEARRQLAKFHQSPARHWRRNSCTRGTWMRQCSWARQAATLHACRKTQLRCSPPRTRDGQRVRRPRPLTGGLRASLCPLPKCSPASFTSHGEGRATVTDNVVAPESGRVAGSDGSDEQGARARSPRQGG